MAGKSIIGSNAVTLDDLQQVAQVLKSNGTDGELVMGFREIAPEDINLQEGVKKGALTQEQADAKLAAWKSEKAAKINAKKAGLSKDAAAAHKAAVEAEAKVNQERAEAIAKRKAEAEEAARAAAEAAAAEKAAQEAAAAEEASAESAE